MTREKYNEGVDKTLDYFGEKSKEMSGLSAAIFIAEVMMILSKLTNELYGEDENNDK